MSEFGSVSAHICRALDSLSAREDRPWIVGLSGPQGSGKSTAARSVLGKFGHRVVILGIDDYYLTRDERAVLAQEVSPLLETRGPPGTHDLDLLNNSLDQLMVADGQTIVSVPRFDKALDDRLPAAHWTSFRGRPDIIVLEGWLIGALPAPNFTAGGALNSVEEADSGRVWRTFQYEQLSGPYARLWDRIDMFIHIKGPGISAVRRWRLQQEAENIGRTGEPLPAERRKWVLNFIEHFERLTTDIDRGFRRNGPTIEIDLDRRVIKAE